jgi:hypothetical protein
MDKIEVILLSCLLCAVGIVAYLLAAAVTLGHTQRGEYAAVCEANGGKAVWNGRFSECLRPR